MRKLQLAILINEHDDDQQRRGPWVKKVAAGSCSFPTDSCNFEISDKGDCMCSKFNVAPKFPQNWGF